MPHAPSFPAEDPDALASRLIQRAHNADGLPEIAAGLIFLVVAALVSAGVVLPADSLAARAAPLAMAVLVPALCLGAPAALRRIRHRFLLDRAGYMQPRPVARRKLGVALAVAAVVAAALVALVAGTAEPGPWVLAGTGLFGGALVAFAGQLPRFLGAGFLMAAFGVALALSGVPLESGFVVLFGTLGMLAVVSGLVRLLAFLRTPVE